MKKYLIRFYRCFFSARGKTRIKKVVYGGLSVWFLCFFVQRAIYPEFLLNEWYFFYFIYCFLFYVFILKLPWGRRTLFFKLRVFQVFSFASVFMLYITIHSLHGFFYLNCKPLTASPVALVIFSVLKNNFG